MKTAVDPLGISVGTACNIRCRHCLVDKNLGAPGISESDIKKLVPEIRKYNPKTIIFTGGEPTLCLEAIDTIVSRTAGRRKRTIKLITNGYFAKSAAEASRVLKAVTGLTSVVMSYDRFHSEFVPRECVTNLHAACKAAGVGFGIMTAVSSPLDAAFVTGLGLKGVKISVQKVLPIGKAEGKSLEYSYPEFDKTVLGRKCPNLGGMIYNSGRGFTVCCGSMASRPGAGYCVHRTVAEHMRSRFYRLLAKHTFGELLKMAGVPETGLRPKHSAPCEVCRLAVPPLFEKKQIRGKGPALPLVRPRHQDGNIHNQTD